MVGVAARVEEAVLGTSVVASSFDVADVVIEGGHHHVVATVC